MSEWISVQDRLPDDEHSTLLVTLEAKVENPHSGFRFVDTDAFYTTDGYFRYWGMSDEYKVTAWMPLPEPAED
jgi:hypothetical protein